MSQYNKNRTVKPGDVVVIGLILFSSLALFYFGNKHTFNASNTAGLFAVISVNGTEVKRMPLDDPATFITDTQVCIQIDEQGVSVTDSDCPDRICIKTGFINQPGELIVCLPNKTSIRIDGAEGEVDGIVS